MTSRRHRSPRTENMKCVRDRMGVIHRFSNEDAANVIRQGHGAVYVAKHFYKEQQKAKA
jgi:hypothetical protein